MPVITEDPARSRRHQTGAVWLLGMTIFLSVFLVPAVHPIGFSIPFSPYGIVAYSLYRQYGNSWSWTPGPKQGFGYEHRMDASFSSYEAYSFRIGPLVYEWQRDRSLVR